MAETRLTQALNSIGIDARISGDGRWARIEQRGCPVYVVETAFGHGFLTWCDHPAERQVQRFSDPTEAVASALRRSRRRLKIDADARQELGPPGGRLGDTDKGSSDR